MTGVELGQEYSDIVCNKFGEMTSILYGSTVFGVNSSDLDICFIREKNLTSNDFKLLKQMTIDYHLANNLRLDEEVPYENKLIYTYDFLDKALSNLPFPKEHNRFMIPKIEKSKEFLTSVDMKKRLILNILTVKHLILSGSEKEIKPYEDKAWDKMIEVIISYANLYEFTIDEIIDCFLYDPYHNVNGEMYLGYKTNNSKKIEYLCSKLLEYLDRKKNEGRIRIYQTDEAKYYVKRRN